MCFDRNEPNASQFSNDSVWCKPDIIRNTRQDQNSTCYNFSADMISKNITGDTLSLNRFMCEGDSAYLARMDIKFGWWIDALLFACSDGNESIWFGNGDYDGLEDTADFGAGLTSISANTLDSDDGSSYPTILTLYGYDEDEGYPDGMILGPYGYVKKTSRQWPLQYTFIPPFWKGCGRNVSNLDQPAPIE